MTEDPLLRWDVAEHWLASLRTQPPDVAEALLRLLIRYGDNVPILTALRAEAVRNYTAYLDAQDFIDRRKRP